MLKVKIAIACLCLLGFTHASVSQDYPLKPITIVVPYTAGSAADVVARIVAQGLQERLKQPVVIDNRPGASGMIGAELVAKSQPDGYTLLMGTNQTHAVNISLFKKLPYDPVRDFEPIAQFGSSPYLLVATANLGLKSVAELVEYARKRSGELNFGSSGIGTSNHLTGELFKAEAKLDIQHVPYKGGTEVITDLIGGRLSILFYPYLTLLPHVQSKALVPLAITSPQRFQALPNVPTMVESGYPKFVAVAFYAILAPAGTPAAIVETLTKAIKEISLDSKVQQSLLQTGTDPTYRSPNELKSFMETETNRMLQVIKASGTKLD